MGNVLLPRVAAQRRAQCARGTRIHGSEGFQGSRTIPGSLYSASSFLGPTHPPETEYKQHAHCHPIIWFQCTSISSLCNLHSTPREAVAKVVGRVVSHTKGHTSIANSPFLVLECPLPGELNVSCPSPQLRGRHGEDSLFYRLQHVAHLQQQHLPAMPSHTRPQIVFTNTSAHEDPDFIRHQAYLAEENTDAHQHTSVKLNTVYAFPRRRCAW